MSLRWIWRRCPPPRPRAGWDDEDTERLVQLKHEAAERLQEQHSLWDRVRHEAAVAKRLREVNDFSRALREAMKAKRDAPG
jgi:hypothetical protein